MKHARLPVCLRIETRKKSIASQYWQTEVSGLALRLRHITLDLIVEFEERSKTFALNDGIVEWREDTQLRAG